MLYLASILVLICGLNCPAARGAEKDAPKLQVDLNGINQDVSWVQNQYHSKLLKKYSYSYWINGWKKYAGDTSRNLLCFETGYYGIIFDMASLDTPRFSVLNDDSNLIAGLEKGTSRVDALDPAELAIEVKQGGKKYRVKNCAAGAANLLLKTIKTVDAGMYVERYLIEKLHLFDDTNTRVACFGSLELVAWPNSLTFTAELAPELPDKKDDHLTVPNWKDAVFSITFRSKKESWVNKAEFKGDWKCGEKKKLTLNCNINSATPQSPDLEFDFSAKERGQYPVKFEPEFNAYVTRIPPLKREREKYSSRGGYDEFSLVINNTSSGIKEIPFHMIMENPWNGCSALNILCYPDGRPTGIHIQGAGITHKNKTFLNPYMLIPVKPGKTAFLHRIAYKYYGTLATAYVHQDCVVEEGYGRWWQLALGGPGEIMTLDGDHGPTDQSICDVRALYLRKGLKGVWSNWTEAGWGGDWLVAFDENRNKLVYNDMKTVVLAHGPCFTDLRFKGYYGRDRSVGVNSKVYLFRADDYSRVLFDIRYDFHKTISAKNSAFFTMGSTMDVPKLAYGNLRGLVKELSSANIAAESKLLNNFIIEGPGPWWVSTPENNRGKAGTEKRPMGYSSLIFRSIDCTLNGKGYNTPTFSIRQVPSKSGVGAHTQLVQPAGVTEFKAGDSVHLNVEWVMLPRIADDYYGPNKSFLKHLEENPKSWMTVYREAKGNNLKVKVSGGHLIESYPLIIKAESSEISFDIEGGVGYVPVRFEGLASDRGYTLYQIINNAEVALDQSTPAGNDFWQTDYDVPSNSYKRSYNMCLDDFPVSKWVLKYKKL